MMDTTEAIDAAAMKLGFRSLKPEQREAIRNFMDGKDVMVVLPTGFGMALCYVRLTMSRLHATVVDVVTSSSLLPEHSNFFCQWIIRHFLYKVL